MPGTLAPSNPNAINERPAPDQIRRSAGNDAEMKASLSWIVAHPFVYYVVGLCTLLWFGTSAAIGLQDGWRKWKSEWIFLALAGCTVLLWRAPTMLWPQPLNIDEGQWAAGALKVTYDFAPWRGFDGTTSGPLNAYVLALPALFGGSITFFSTRMIACGLIVLTIYALYFIVKWTHGADIGRLSIVPPVGFLGLTWQWDFLHFASETFPVFLTTTGMAAAVYLATGVRPRKGRLAACALAGLVLGSAGFAKLQALPIALAALAFIGGVILLRRGPSRKERSTEALTTVGSFLLVPMAITLSVLATGVWNDAVTSYFKYAVFHVTSGTTVGFTYFFITTVTYTVFLVGTLVIIAVGTVASIGRARFTKRSAIIAACALGFLLVSLTVIVLPRHPYPHYLLFSVMPLSYCAASVLGFTRVANLWPGKETLFSAVIATGFLVPALGLSMAYPNFFVGNLRELLLAAHPELATSLPFRQTAPQVLTIKKYVLPGSRIAIWGWMPHYYVQTQTIPATRDAHTLLQTVPGPYQEYFRARFLSDLRALPPPVFIDAAAPVAFGINDRATQGIEIFPALAAFLDENYVLKEDIEGVRFFVRKDDKGLPLKNNHGER